MLSHSVDIGKSLKMVGRYIIELSLLILIWISGTLIDFLSFDWLNFLHEFSEALIWLLKFAGTVLVFATIYVRYRMTRRQEEREKKQNSTDA